MALTAWASSASSTGICSWGKRCVREWAETLAATSPMRRSGRKPLRAAQAPSRAVARAERPTVSQIKRCMRCRKCWWWVMSRIRVSCGESSWLGVKGAMNTR